MNVELTYIHQTMRETVTQTHEHKHPWVKKGEYTVLKTLEPKFNKLVFFDGLKFPHGNGCIK